MTVRTTGEDCVIDPGATVGYEYTAATNDATIGDDATIRAGTIIYGDVAIGDGFTTGHHAIVREETVVGDDVLVGTKSVIDGRVEIGDAVSIQTDVYIPQNTVIGDRVFFGPCAVLTNDPYPLRTDVDNAGPTIANDVTIGANATLLPDISVGEKAFVAAGAVVTDDVPANTLAVGAPAVHRELPPKLKGGNQP